MTQVGQAGPSVGLCMIVRNEERVLRRCLLSVLRAVELDYWTIVDTGSTDETMTIAGRELAGRPGSLHRIPWGDDFAEARNQALDLARGSADWLLLLDADMTVHRTAPVGLSGDGISLRCSSVQTPGTWWTTVRLIRSAAPWVYRGAVHEALTSPSALQVTTGHGIQIVHHEDGGNREGRLRRDEKALTAMLATDPDDSRSWYYLGQTLLEAQRPGGAMGAFTRCIERTTSGEEAYLARWHRGHCWLAQGLTDRAVAEWLEATTLRPGRLEAFATALGVLRSLGNVAAARELLDAMGPLPELSEDCLHVRPSLYMGELHREQERAERQISAGGAA